MNDEIKLKDMIDFFENVYKDIKKQPTLKEELEKERKFINKIKGDNKDEVKELLEHIEILDNTDYILHSDKAKKLLDYITNLQEENEFLKLNNPEMNIEHFRIVKENKRKIDNLRKENERLNNIIKNLDKMFEYYFLGNLKYDQDTVNTIYIKYVKLKKLKEGK